MPSQPQKPKTKDPRQMELRSNKKQWSAEVSNLIAKIIAFKRSVNGRGDARFNLPPSNIKDPLPTEVSSTLQQLTSEFGKIVSDAEGIIAAQQQYSATRRKRQPKKPKPATPRSPTAPAQEAPQVAPAPVEDNPLARIGALDVAMEKIASNKLTRFWQYITSVFSRKEYNRQRLGMLSLSADLYYNLLDFENDVLKLNEKTTPAMINKFQNMRNTNIALKKLFDGIAALLVQKAKQEGVAVPVPEKTTDQSSPQTSEQQIDSNGDESPAEMYVDQIQHNLEKLKGKVKDKTINELLGMINAFNNEEDPHTKNIWLDQIKEEYTNIQQQLKNGDKTASVKLAHNAITRFLRRQLIKAAPHDKTAAPRLRAAELADETKKTVKRLMDVLEKDLSVDEVSILLSQIDKHMFEITQSVSIINVLYKERFSKERNESDKDLDMALRRKVRKDLFQGIL